MAFTIVAFGEVLWDLLPTGRVLGGAPFNFVYRVASIGDRGTIVSRLGDDDLGREAFAIIRRSAWIRGASSGTRAPHGHGAGDARRRGRPTSPSSRTWPTITSTRPPTEAAVGGGRLPVFRDARPAQPRVGGDAPGLLGRFNGRIRLLDLNLRRDCWTPESVRSSIERADVLKLNDDEAAVVAPFFGLDGVPMHEIPGRLLAGTRLSHVVITLGSHGAFAASRTGESVYEPAHAVEVVDTVGSGDAFTAGFAHGLLAGWPLARSLAYGNALGALVAGQRGATGAVTPADVERLLRADRRREADPRFA